MSQLKVGDWFDCKDSYEQWQVAKVTSVTSAGLGVTYKGFSKYYDEVVPKTLARIAEVGYHLPALWKRFVFGVLISSCVRSLAHTRLEAPRT
jgi:hypothetical protein